MNIPKSDNAKRIAALFGRKLGTAWSDREVKAFRKLDISGADLTMIERYYAFERRKGDKGWHKRDLGTFLNQYEGAVDRAKDHCRTHPVTYGKPKKVEPQIGEYELTDEQIARNKAIIAPLIESLRRQFHIA